MDVKPTTMISQYNKRPKPAGGGMSMLCSGVEIVINRVKGEKDSTSIVDSP